MKIYLITYMCKQSGSCDLEDIKAENLEAAEKYAEENKRTWAVKSIKELN